MDAGKRYFTGTAVRGYTAAIQSFGLLEEVRKRLPPDTLALVEKPPLATTWVEGRHIDLLLEAVRDLAGEQEVVDVAEGAGRGDPGRSPFLKVPARAS